MSYEFHTDWVTSDLNRYEREQALYEENSPTCDICGETICGEYLWELDDTIYCEDCWDEFCDEHRKDVTEFIEEVAYEQHQREWEYAQDAKADRGDNEWKEREFVNGKRGH